MMIWVFPHLCCWFPLKNWWELFKHHHCGPHVLVRLINHCEITVNSSSTKCFQFSSHPTFPMIPQNFPRFSQIVIFRSPHSVLLTVQPRFQLSFVHQQASTSVWVLCGHFMLNQFPQVFLCSCVLGKTSCFPQTHLKSWEMCNLDYSLSFWRINGSSCLNDTILFFIFTILFFLYCTITWWKTCFYL